MKSVLRATALLSTSSVVTILVGLVSAKVYAVLLGPSGIGFMGLLQSLLGLTGLIAGMGIGTGVVRLGAKALEAGETARVVALRSAAWVLFWSFGSLGVLLLTAFRAPVSALVLGAPEHGPEVVLMGVALLFTLASGLQIKILNAYHRVQALAKWGVLNSFLGTLVSLGAVWTWGVAGIPAAVIAGTVVSWLVSGVFLRQEVATPNVQPSRKEHLRAARDLLYFGLPFTASALVGTGVQFLLPSLILHELGREGVGFYRAAVAISVGYLGFLLTAMAQDYYPRVAAVRTNEELTATVNQQHWLVMTLGVPLILGALALAPFLVSLVYSNAFAPAVGVLEWQLLGALFQFSSWTMSFVILARSTSVTYFFTELVGGGSMLICSYVAMQWFGLTGLGIGFLASYMLYYLSVWLTVKRRFNFSLDVKNVAFLLTAVAAALFIQLLPGLGLQIWRFPVALALAALFGLRSLSNLYSIFRGSKIEMQVS